MVFGPKFPWGKACQLFGCQKKRARFDPFADEEVRTTPLIESMLKLPDLGNPSQPTKEPKQTLAQPPATWPPTWEPEPPLIVYPVFVAPSGFPEAQPPAPVLHQPRPVRVIAIRDALDRFEKEAQSTDDAQDYASSSSSSCTSGSELQSSSQTSLTDDVCEEASGSDRQINSSEEIVRPGAPRPSDSDDVPLITRSLAKARAIGNICFHPPTPPPRGARPTGSRPSGELARQSPGSLESSSSLERLTDLPRPIFVPQRRAARVNNTAPAPTPAPSPAPTPAPTSADSEEETAVEGDCGSSEDWTAVQVYGTEHLHVTIVDDDEFSDEEDEDEEGNALPPLFPNFSDVEEDNFSDVSDESEYDDEAGYNGDDEGAEEIESRSASPQPASSSSTPSVRLVTSASSSSSTVSEPLPLENTDFRVTRSLTPEAWSTSVCEEIEEFINGDD